jgi:Holliday junction resolvase RusA-like endonuclease
MTMQRLAFEVLGLPAPQGSKTKMPNGHMLDANTPAGRVRHKAWREAVHEAATDAIDVLREEWTNEGALTTWPSSRFDGPIAVHIVFRLPMPKSRPAEARRRGVCASTVKPDIDKLVRSTLDALTTSGLVADDARIWDLYATKIEVAAGWIGARIEVRSTPMLGDDVDLIGQG